MRFTKSHGIGNDFILIKETPNITSWASLAPIMCNRNTGIGADGIIIASPSSIADIKMQIINSDGSEAEMCGNGIRCITKFAFDEDLLSTKTASITVETGAGIQTVFPIWENGVISRVKVNMGSPIFEPDRIPVTLPEMAHSGNQQLSEFTLSIENMHLPLSFVSMGNPHAVYFSEQPVETFPIMQIGPKVEHHEIFPKRVNFHVAHIKNSSTIDQVVWERGAGPTMACGSGGCASVVAAQRKGLVGNKVNVNLPGGTLVYTWDGKTDIWMEGPVETAYFGEWFTDC